MLINGIFDGKLTQTFQKRYQNYRLDRNALARIRIATVWEEGAGLILFQHYSTLWNGKADAMKSVAAKHYTG